MFICTTKYKIQIIKSCFIRKNSGSQIEITSADFEILKGPEIRY